MSQLALFNIEASHPQIATQFDGDSGSAIPIANVLTIEGLTVANATYGKPVHVSASGGTVVVNAQVAATVAAAPGNTTKAGIVQPDSTDFVVDADGYMTLAGAGAGQTITGDTGGALTPTAGNWNFFTTEGLATSGAASTLTISPANDLAAIEALGSTGIAVRTALDTWAQRTIIGTADFTTVTNGSGAFGNPVIGIDTEFECTGMHGWNGSIIETPAVSAASDGATITFSVEQSGGGDLTVVFSDGYYVWDTSPAATIALTAGTDTVPTMNWVYFLQSTKALTVSTVGWPSAEHARLAKVFCESAATFQTKKAMSFHAYTDHVVSTIDLGHINDLGLWVRKQPATYESGCTQTYTIVVNGGAADNVTLETAIGSVLQLHPHTFPAFSNPVDYYVVNDSVTPFTIVTDLNALLTDSAGVSMSGKYFSYVIWGCVSEDTGDCKIYVNLPGGSYNNQSSLLNDVSGYSNYTIPGDFVGTGFLISEWKLRHQVAASGTWTSIDEINLLGLFPSLSAGGSATTVTLTADDAVIVPPTGGTITVAGRSGSKTSGSGSTL
ncbi:MAG: hypothetical protein KAS32_30555, partial [Candidatus Peribacteraceae bacterium]|nr:hypothetical protein [Candidatus Peribacteraceae bacterium]